MALKLRGALLGAGNIALRGHAPQWTGDATLHELAQIVAVCDLSPANLDSAREWFPQARRYESAEELLRRETLDFCDVCTPPFTHRPLVEAAAARGVHVLCEKPIACSLADAEAIADVVRRAGVVFAPCHQYHYSPQWQAVKRLLPAIGRVHLVEYEVLRTEANPGNPNWTPAWRTDRALAGGGILFDHGAHIFYQLRSVLGEPASVQATLRTLRHADYGVEDSAFVVLDYGDRLAEVRLTWAARRRSIRFQFVGADGELSGDDHGLVLRAARTEQVGFGEGMSRNSSHSEWYAPLLRGFIERVRAREASREPLDEALYVARVIACAYQSSTEQRALPLTSASPAPLRVGRALSELTAVVSDVVEETPTEASTDVPEIETARRAPWVARLAGVGILLLAAGWIAHDLQGEALRHALGEVQPAWVALAAAVNLMAVFAMAGRWRALLRPIAPLVGQLEAFKAMLMGFAVSTVVPARAGELARAEWLRRRAGLPRASILGSILLDHLVNAVGMFTGLALLPLLVPLPGWLRSALWLALGVFGVVSCTVFLLRPRPGQPAPYRAPLPGGRVGSAVTGFLARARLGFTAVRDGRALARSFGASLVAWLIEIEVVFLAMRALSIYATLPRALLVLMAVNLALLVPFAPPGNLGSLELGATLGLMEFGVPKEQALAFAIVYHLLQVIPIGFAGLALASKSLWRPLPEPITAPSNPERP